jgi:hypothetical protein
MELVLVIVGAVVALAVFGVMYALVDRMPFIPGLPHPNTSRDTVLCESQHSESLSI